MDGRGSGSASAMSMVVETPSCALCSEHPVLPKLLPCSHTFCQRCIQQLVGRHPTFRCPTCRFKITVPHGGVRNLRDNVLLPSVNTPTLSEKVRNPCHKHIHEEVTHFCSDCDKLLCGRCKKRHLSTHTLVDVTDEVKRVKHLFSDLNKKNIQANNTVIERLHELQTLKASTAAHYDSQMSQLESMIHFYRAQFEQRCSEMERAINRRKQYVLNKLNEEETRLAAVRRRNQRLIRRRREAAQGDIYADVLDQGLVKVYEDHLDEKPPTSTNRVYTPGKLDPSFIGTFR